MATKKGFTVVADVAAIEGKKKASSSSGSSTTVLKTNRKSAPCDLQQDLEQDLLLS